MNVLLLLPVLFPIAVGIFCGLYRPFRTEAKGLNQLVVAALAVEFALCIGMCFADSPHLVICNITPKLPIFLRVDLLGKIVGVLACGMWLLCGIYSQTYMTHEGRQHQFFCFFLCTLGSLMGAVMSGNFVTFYLFFEGMTFLSMPLVLHSGTKESIAAAKKYLYYSVFGAAMALLGGFFSYAYCASGEFTPGGSLSVSLMGTHRDVLLAVSLLTVIGFGAKAGMFPLHGWLPTAHPVAPAPASALLSGVITKIGVLGIIRYIFYVVGADFLRGTYVQYTLIILALITIFMGSMLAYKEKIFKKRLAYSSVSQVSYVLLGIFFMNPVGMLGAMLHLVFHSVMKNCLFMTAGSVIYKTGITDVRKLTGIGKKMPVTMWCFTLAGLSLVGIPPLCGVVSKWYLAQGSLGSGIAVLDYLAPVVLLASALLTAGYLFTVSVKAFLPGSDFNYNGVAYADADFNMLLGPVVLAGLCLVFGIYPAPLIHLFETLLTALF